MSKFYVVEIKYVGPNHNVDDRIEIRTKPAKTNRSHEVKLDGWCGTTNDWAVYAHGEYQTEQEARDYIENAFGPVVEDADTGDYDLDKEGDPIQVAIFMSVEYDSDD